LREHLAQLLERVTTLEGWVAKDSHNSSKPPSSDGLRRKPKSLCRPSGRKADGQR
jgi:transposase